MIWHKKDWWYSEPLKEREYSCGLDGKKLPWNGISHHFKHAHNEIYEQFRLMVEQRIFTLQEELVCEGLEIQTNQNMSVELEEIKPVKSSYTLPQNLIQIDSEGYAHCECSGRFFVKKDGKDAMKQHEKTVMHKKYLQSINPIPVNVLSYGNHR